MKKSKRMIAGALSLAAVVSLVSISAFAAGRKTDLNNDLSVNENFSVRTEQETGNIQISKDGGKTWDDVIFGFEGDIDENAEVSITFNDSSEAVVAGTASGENGDAIVEMDEESGTARISKDGGKTWENIDVKKDGETMAGDYIQLND